MSHDKVIPVPEVSRMKFKFAKPTRLEFAMDKNEPTKEMVTITKKEYDKLVEDSKFLGCLYEAGVDNWEGISDAQQMMEEE